MWSSFGFGIFDAEYYLNEIKENFKVKNKEELFEFAISKIMKKA